MPRTQSISRDTGITLVEVLVTLVILAIGLLGLVALHGRVQVLQAEAYQRAQALMLLKDMSARISNNRNSADAYVTGAEEPLGGDEECPAADATRASVDLREWCLALQGASEREGATNVGAMLGGRGCVERPVPGQYLVTVAWQGLAPTTAPPEDVACAADPAIYGGEGTVCEGDLCRRVVTTVVIIPDLT